MFRLSSATVFAGAALLFFIEPVIAKTLLPRVGGSAAVWTTCLLFFQATLLAAYAYAHLLPRWLGERRHAVLHLVLLALPLLVLPPTIVQGAPDTNPVGWVLTALLGSVGLPFFVLATTAPLLQRWTPAEALPRDRYILYAASNAGSFLSLLVYPFVVEPLVSLSAQRNAFAVAYVAFAALAAVSSWARVKRPEVLETDPSPSVTTRQLLRWVTLALVPSSLMLGATSVITTDIASVPLVWMIPLGLYLLTFVVAFAGATPRAGLAIPFVGLAALLFLLSLMPVVQHLVVGALHLSLVFLGGLIFHGELARGKPKGDPTLFYLALALGGALGGLLNAVVAPLVFRRVLEYPLTMVLALVVLGNPPLLRSPQERQQAFLRSAGLEVASPPERAQRLAWLDWAVPCGVGALALALMGVHPVVQLSVPFVVAVFFSLGRRGRLGWALGAIALATSLTSRAVVETRSFFSVLRVTDAEGYRVLSHGSTIHGRQHLDPARRQDPTDYFVGPAADIVGARPAGSPVAVFGLGVGTLASYGKEAEHWTFYEVDPNVVRLARTYFSFLADTPAQVDVVVGDARLAVGSAPDGYFGLIVADAFSSDAIPTHLLTRQAIVLYLQKLAPQGLLAFNITNRYVRLGGLLGQQAREAGLLARIRSVPAAARVVATTWVVMARAFPVDLGPNWSDLAAEGKAWTDDYSNLASVVKL